MDGNKKRVGQSSSRRLQHDHNVYEEVFKLSRSGKPKTPPNGGHRLVRESDTPDIEVTLDAKEPIRIRIRG